MAANKLVTMANQIGTFFTSQGQSEAVTGTVTHLKKFWDPRMRAAIIAHLRAGGEGLRPEVRLAVETLASEAGEPAKAAAPAAPARREEKEAGKQNAAARGDEILSNAPVTAQTGFRRWLFLRRP
jgi:formate dehydrogenase subunit delta